MISRNTSKGVWSYTECISFTYNNKNIIKKIHHQTLERIFCAGLLYSRYTMHGTQGYNCVHIILKSVKGIQVDYRLLNTILIQYPILNTYYLPHAVEDTQQAHITSSH